MKLSEFDYTLPKELIAQYPSEKRGDDRLLVLERGENTFEEKKFSGIVDYFKEGDLLVLNNAKVIPARLFGKRKTGGKVEIFVLDKAKEPVEALVRPSGRIAEGETVTLESGDEVEILGKGEIGRFVRFKRPLSGIFEECGHVPLPPYISRPDEPADKERYQTVFARQDGATASPTAGLHFTEDMLKVLRKKGVRIVCITLHVSYGTFAPVKEENVRDHKMHSEFYHISRETAREINKERGRIFACGTTALRAIETFVATGETEGLTDLFIYPGYEFKAVGALITNFHLPKSTLILLASAFAGKEFLFKAYWHAVENGFRFFSYGDCMLII